jgi:eukaryotic-like serine/threonine-protein kinase
MAELRSCPSRDELQRMILNQLPDAEALMIQQHVDRCPSCRRALEECVTSDDLLEAVRARGRVASEPTKTIYLPVEWIRGAVLTWIRAHDSTQSGENALPVSTADIKRLLDPPQMPGEIGRIADFHVLQVLGVGGMAVVFEAEDSRLKRHVALKLMHPAVAAKPGGLDRFLREAQSAAALKHEHVVTIYQVGMHGQTPFIALELLHGESLEEHLLHNGRPSLSEVIRIGREIALGLRAAHAEGLLHRDIKPANIWLEQPETNARDESGHNNDSGHNGNPHSAPATVMSEAVPSTNGRPHAGKVKILDFGCAKILTGDSGATQLGLLIGTPSYMAPEQLTGKPVDPRADLFSLGCVLYRIAGCKRPFGGDDLLSVVRALALDEPAPLSDLNPHVPRRLSDLVGKLLSKSRDDRPASAQAVLDEFNLIEQELSPERAAETPTPDPRVTPSAAGRRRNNNWLVGGAIGFALVLPFFYYLFGVQLIRIATAKGQIVLEIDDPSIGITVTEHQVVLHDGQGHTEITLAAGEHQLDVTVKQPSGDAKFSTEKFTLHRGGKKVIEVRQELALAALSEITRAKTAPSQITRSQTRSDAVTDPNPPSSRSPTASGRAPQSPPTPNLDRSAASWALANGGTLSVRMAHDAQTREVRPGEPLPEADFELTGVRLMHCPVTDAGLEHLRGLKHLVEFSLNGAPVTDTGVQCLQGLTELKHLTLSNTGLTNDGLQSLESLAKLESISLDGTRVTDAGLKHLESHKNLSLLDLSWMNVTDACLAHVGRLPQLRLLSLRKTRVTDVGLSSLRPLSNLRYLYLEQTRVTDAGLAQLKNLPLKTLFLDETAITDDGLTNLAGLKDLQTLSLKGLKHVSDAAVSHIVHLRQLRKIDLSDCRVSANGLAVLKSAMPKVSVEWSEPNYSAASAVFGAKGTVDILLDATGRKRHIKTVGELPTEPLHLVGVQLRGGRATLNQSLLALAKPGLDALVSLDLSDAVIDDADVGRLTSLVALRDLRLARTPITDACLPHLGAFRALERLDLDDTAIHGHGLLHLQELPHLRELSLGCPQLTELFLVELSRLKNLERLSLAKSNISNESVNTLTRLTQLQQLNLSDTKIAAAQAAALQKSLPHCHILWTPRQLAKP